MVIHGYNYGNNIQTRKLISRIIVYSGNIWLYYEYVSHLRWFRCTPPSTLFYKTRRRLTCHGLAPITSGFGDVALPVASTPRRTAWVARSMSCRMAASFGPGSDKSCENVILVNKTMEQLVLHDFQFTPLLAFTLSFPFAAVHVGF